MMTATDLDRVNFPPRRCLVSNHGSDLLGFELLSYGP